MNKITLIQNKLQSLPDKDKTLCEKFLNKRDFVSIKEIVDSDVEKLYKKISGISTVDSDMPLEYLEYEEQYNNIKELQTLINEQAAIFGIEENINDFEYLC